MGELRCVDGSVLSVEPVSCCDRAGQPYEITLRLARNSVPFAAVGQRCGAQLARLAGQVSAARQDLAQAAQWPDPDDRFPVTDDRELFALRSAERVDLPGTGELRCVLRSSAVWMADCNGTGRRAGRDRASGHGRWHRSRRALIEAWGPDGLGVRAVLTSAELAAFLDTVLREPAEDFRRAVPAARTKPGALAGVP